MEIVDPPLLGHPPDPRRPPFVGSATGYPGENTRGPLAATPFPLTAFASPPMTHIHDALLRGDTPTTATAVPQCAALPPFFPPLSLSSSRGLASPLPSRTGRSCPLRFPLRSSRSAFAGALSSFLPSRSRLRFFGSRVTDPPARPSVPPVRPPARPPARSHASRGPGGTASDDRQSRAIRSCADARMQVGDSISGRPSAYRVSCLSSSVFRVDAYGAVLEVQDADARQQSIGRSVETDGNSVEKRARIMRRAGNNTCATRCRTL
jgi:hypothetical protein